MSFVYFPEYGDTLSMERASELTSVYCTIERVNHPEVCFEEEERRFTGWLDVDEAAVVTTMVRWKSPPDELN